MKKDASDTSSIQSIIPIQISPTALQVKILLHLCMTENATYDSLTREIGRDRTTILESMESLIKHNYVEKQKINPDHPKSKLIFIPTLRGIAVAWTFIRFDINHLIKTKEEDEIAKYLRLVKDFFDHKQQGPMLSSLFKTIERDYLKIQGKGDTEKHRLVKESFANGILELLQNKDYDAKRIFNHRSIQSLRMLYSRAELNELKGYFELIRKNLASTIQWFPA